MLSVLLVDDEIAGLPRECHNLSRLAQGVGYRSAKRKLRCAVNKKQNLLQVANEVGGDPWAFGYKSKLCGNLVNSMPTDPVRVDDNNVEGAGKSLPTMKELVEGVLSFKDKGAPESDDITAEIYKLVFYQRSDLLLGALNTYGKRACLLIAGSWQDSCERVKTVQKFMRT